MINQIRFCLRKLLRLDKAPVAFVECQSFLGWDPANGPVPGKLAQGRPLIDVENNILKELVKGRFEPG